MHYLNTILLNPHSNPESGLFFSIAPIIVNFSVSISPPKNTGFCRQGPLIQAKPLGKIYCIMAVPPPAVPLVSRTSILFGYPKRKP